MRESAYNLVHYLAVRRHDVRELQDELTRLGLSSLGRMEAHVMASLQAVLEVLCALRRQPVAGRDPGRAAGDLRHRRRAARGARQRDPRTRAARARDADHGDDARRGGGGPGADTRPGRGRHGGHAHQLRARQPQGLGADGQAPAPRRARDRQALRIVLRPRRTEAAHRADRAGACGCEMAAAPRHDRPRDPARARAAGRTRA